MIHYSEEDIEDLDKVFRINLVNSCTGYKSANLIGTKSNEGIPNVAVFSSIVHLGSNPPLLGFFLRPTEIFPRNTYTNIKENGVYTINSIYREIIDDSHHTSAKYDKNISEFSVTNLEEEYINKIYPPFVKNSPIKIEMKFIEEIKIKVNKCKLIVGKIVSLHLEKKMLEKDGFLSLNKGEIPTISGCDAYSIPEDYDRKKYQKPNK
ncbi:MAG: flavin oxidoreductase [Flavobacteriales bacterium]|jgi:flavin reductase (DIM6/NTAB) family NADH-FMN oxidoreductase RutF|nr:MAG: flavin oxidoreductase [Flavobacteriales bacterium]|tara:strand:+ start:887 stop:1507 length:621 start_codon:yes stop_codon:yes gene_type:complete